MQTFHQHAYDLGVKDLDLNTIGVLLFFGVFFVLFFFVFFFVFFFCLLFFVCFYVFFVLYLFFVLFFSFLSVHSQWIPQAKGGVTLKYNGAAKYFGKSFSALSRFHGRLNIRQEFV